MRRLLLEPLSPRLMLSATLFGTDGNDVFSYRDGVAILNGVEYRAEHIVFDGRGGQDVVSLFDSAGDDHFVARPGEASLTGDGYHVEVRNAEIIHGYAKAGGSDTATLYDSLGDDILIAKTDWAKNLGEGFFNRAKFFETVEAIASEGSDVAVLYDSAGDDTLYASPGDVTLTNSSYTTRVRSFDFVHAYARYGGDDVAHMQGLEGDDYFVGMPNWGETETEGYQNWVTRFETINQHSTDPETPTDDPMVLVGTHTLRRSLVLETGDTLSGTATLTRPDRIQAELTEPVGPGDTTIHVTSTSGYQVGDELGLFAYGAKPTWFIVAELGEDWITIETPLTEDYRPEDGAALVNYFPLVRAVGSNITIEGLTFDGNHDLSSLQWQITGGGLIHMEATNSVIRDCTVEDAFSEGIVLSGGSNNLIENTTVIRSRGHGILLDKEIGTTVRNSVSSRNGYKAGKVLGDGIIANGGMDHRIENNLTEYNARYGLHIAGELTIGGVWSRNVASNNRSNGLHFCYNNQYVRVTGNTLNNNKSGIGGLGLGGEYGDRFNTIIGNVAHGNRRFGIETNGGAGNVIRENDLRGNRLGGVLVVGDHDVWGNLED